MVSHSNEKLFKGATFLSFSDVAGAAIWGQYPDIIFQPKLGVGSVYMNTPHDVDKSVQAWFAVRAALSVNIWLSGFIQDFEDSLLPVIGLEFDYTLGISPPNVFDHQRLTHFIGAKFKVWI